MEVWRRTEHTGGGTCNIHYFSLLEICVLFYLLIFIYLFFFLFFFPYLLRINTLSHAPNATNANSIKRLFNHQPVIQLPFLRQSNKSLPFAVFFFSFPVFFRLFLLFLFLFPRILKEDIAQRQLFNHPWWNSAIVWRRASLYRGKGRCHTTTCIDVGCDLISLESRSPLTLAF